MMNYKFINNNSINTIILFHGTGGSLFDLINIGKAIDNKANILSIEGHILEGNLKRYFKRFPDHSFDEESLDIETTNVYNFINTLIIKYNLNKDNLSSIGFSNGANLIASFLFKYPTFFKTAILFSAMLPYKNKEPINNITTNVYLSIGKNDTLIPIESALLLNDKLLRFNKNVYTDVTNQGHMFSKENVLNAKYFYEKNNKAETI